MKNFSHSDVFGWVFFILTLATFNVGVYERFVPTNDSNADALGKVEVNADRLYPESSVSRVVRQEVALVSETFGETFANVQTTARRATSTASGRATRSTSSNFAGGNSRSFQTASNRFAYERDGFNAFLFRSPQSSLIETCPLFLLLSTLLN